MGLLRQLLGTELAVLLQYFQNFAVKIINFNHETFILNICVKAK